MATTNSTTTHKLNYYLLEDLDNSGMDSYICTASGNNGKSKVKRILNHTFTLDGAKYEGDTSARLLDYNDKVYKVGGTVHSSLQGHNWVHITGHPDKFIYDYQQDYNNCGVDSCLNILSMAGKKDIVEITPSYAEYLKTPLYRTTNKAVWDGTKWVKEEVTEAYYPNAPKVETEDAFLLWAVQNSDNDAEKYLKDYEIADMSNEELKQYLDTYVIHSKNYHEYNKISDLQAHPTEVGGTYAWMHTNILNAQGVDASMMEGKIQIKINDSQPNNPEDIVSTTYEQGVDKDGAPCTVQVVEKTVVEYNNSYTMKRVTHSIERYKATPSEKEPGKYEKGELLSSWAEVTTDYTLKREQFYFAEWFREYLQNGQGLVINGFANQFIGGSGGGHAIVLNGVVETYTNPALKKTYEIFEDGVLVGGDEPIYAHDILGFYVLDTGGWLGNIEGSQYVSIDMMYNFLTNGAVLLDKDVAGIPGETLFQADYDALYETYFNVTTENIRIWADKMDLVGNDRKNVLIGNNADNSIWGQKGNDSLVGGNGDDKLYGGNDDDTIVGCNGDDTLYGGKGNDLYIVSAFDGGFNDVIVTGGGIDSIQFDNYANGDYYSTFAYDYTGFSDDFKNEYVGSYIVDKDSFKYQNQSGNLLIEYVVKNTAYDSEAGSVIENFIDGSITVLDYFKKSLYSSIKNILTATIGGTVDETINLVNDVLRVDYLKYSINGQIANKISGTKFKDDIIGGEKNDSINGYAENDSLTGGAGNDTIKGGAGDDTIIASYGSDKLYGEAGNNTFIYDTAIGGNDTIYSGKGKDHIELTSLTRDDLLFVKSGSNLVITYNKDKGSSITVGSYFSKKGKTSVVDIKLASSDYLTLYNNGLAHNDYYTLIMQNLVASEKINKSKSTVGENIVTGIGYDTITSGKYDDTINGGLGNDVIKSGAGNDVITGGLGNDKMYGQAADSITGNRYVFEQISSGNDTIYTTGSGKTVVDFSATDIDFTNQGVAGAYNDGYSYTKSGNDLILNYASDLANYDTSSIRFSNFFKSKNTFTLVDGTGEELDLKNAIVYFDGADSKKNKLTGSSINDYMLGKDLADSLKGGAGNDTLVGGLAKDTLVGGTGQNTIEHAKGDGDDVIVLTKGENLTINLTGDITASDIKYTLVKKDFVISYLNDDGIESKITLKNFGTKDVTNNANTKKKLDNTSSVELFINGAKEKDLREDQVFENYTNFSYKKYKYSGNWHTETIDASSMNDEQVYNPKKRGASINAAAGHDSIIGSIYNDTIKGGTGDDVITAKGGVNKVDGNNGSDKYHLFVDNTPVKGIENTVITDTGKGATDVDTAYIYSTKENTQIWFNIDKYGKSTYKFNISEFVDGKATGNKSTISGVEEIVTNENTSGDLYYQYDNENLKNQVVAFLGTNYKDVNQVMSKGSTNEINELIAIFNNSEYWTATP